jgi:Cft2 family RNA processing exonuclease
MAPRWVPYPAIGGFSPAFRFPWLGVQRQGVCTTQALELLDSMLKDAAHLQEKDSEWENRRRAGNKLIAPLYTVQDADDILTLGEPLVYGQKTRITRDAERSAIPRH